MNIVVIGVGYVGLISGLGLSKLNHNVQFLDIDSKKIEKLKNNISPFFEPELNQYLNNQELKNFINFYDNYDSISWNEADIVMVCVQTPALDDKQIDVSFLSNVFQDIQIRMKQATNICLKSSIHPKALEKVLDLSSITEDQIVFNPEFLREGSAFYDFFNPDRIVIGSKNELNSQKVAELYEGIDTKIIFTDPISSQLIKYLSNAYLPLRLSFVNEASQIINELGGNLKETLEGIGLDKRIGSEYFRPSPGWGGSCFPKDVSEVLSVSKANNLDLPIISAIKESNERHKKWFAKYLKNIKSEKNYDNIILIGLAFKENTDDLRHSPTIGLYNELKNHSVSVFDINFDNHNSIELITKFIDNSLIVEMYPISGDFQNSVINGLKNIENYEYIKFWE